MIRDGKLFVAAVLFTSHFVKVGSEKSVLLLGLSVQGVEVVLCNLSGGELEMMPSRI